MNKNLFKFYAAEHNESLLDVADILGIGYPALSSKMNGKSSFKVTEVKILRQHWSLSLEEIDKIFLL